MSYPELLRRRDLYQPGRASVPELTPQSYEQASETEYTHNSTAIKGDTLTLMEIKVLLENGIVIGGRRLGEIYETINHQKAYRYVKECITKEQPLNEKIIKEIRALLMENIFVGGIYRNVDVYISGAQYTPPSPGEMYRQVKDFYADLTWKGKEMSPIELAAQTHAEFVRIHPFPDGNGRTSRLTMNYQLLADGFPAVSIAKESRLDYFNTLEAYAVEDNLVLFAEMVANLTDQQLDRCLDMMEPSQDIQQSPKM